MSPILRGDSFDRTNKGTNGRWTELLTAQDVTAYDARARAEPGEDGAYWLATGELRS